MSLVTETGTGDSTAESLCSVAFADALHSDRGNTAWAALTTAVKEQSLRKATDYMAQAYGSRWAGYRMTATQALEWPRSYVPRIPSMTGDLYYADDAVPVEVQRACAELALRAASGDLLADLTQGVVSEQIGSIVTTYDKFSPQTVRYASVDALLRPYLLAAGVKVVRA